MLSYVRHFIGNFTFISVCFQFQGMTAAPLTSESDGERGATNYIHSTALHSQSTDGNQVTADGKNVQTYMDGSQFVLNKANNTTSPIPNSHAQQLKPKKGEFDW